jgi:Bax protein
MNVRIVRAIDIGRNYAFAGVFTTCLFTALTMTPGLPHVNLMMPQAVAATMQEEMGLELPPPDEPPAVELSMATLPRLEMAIVELPMAPPPFGAEIADSEAAAPDSVDTLSASRPLHGRLSHAAGPIRRQVMSMQVGSASELTRAFEAHDYTLDQTRRGEPVPPLQIDRVPSDLVTIKDGNERKALFIKALLPIVLEVNERIMAERDHLMRLHERHRVGRSLSTIERMWLAEVADRYGTEPMDFVELLKRVDIVPPSMAIAQAGVESGWGTSYAARVGNSLFGQIQFGGRHAVNVPWKPGPAMPQPFSSVSDSVEAYFLNLNTHFAYTTFRTERARLRKEGKEPDGHHLIGQLVRYSELGHGYIRFVRAVIRENRLSDFDRARLPPI